MPSDDIWNSSINFQKGSRTVGDAENIIQHFLITVFRIESEFFESYQSGNNRSRRRKNTRKRIQERSRQADSRFRVRLWNLHHLEQSWWIWTRRGNQRPEKDTRNRNQFRFELLNDQIIFLSKALPYSDQNSISLKIHHKFYWNKNIPHSFLSTLCLQGMIELEHLGKLRGRALHGLRCNQSKSCFCREILLLGKALHTPTLASIWFNIKPTIRCLIVRQGNLVDKQQTISDNYQFNIKYSN